MEAFEGLGKALRFLREQRGKKQKDVAEGAGVTPPMISAYENGRTRPELRTLDKIIHRGLGASLADLCWALDIVNDRLPSVDRLHDGGELRQRSPAAETPATPLAEPLEAGFDQIVQGLMRISRHVYETVVHEQERAGLEGSAKDQSVSDDEA